MNSDARPAFWKRLVLTVLRVMLAILILALLAVVGFYAFKVTQRSFDNVATRIEINRRDLESLQSEFTSLATEAPDQQRQIADLRLTSNDLDRRLNEFGIEIDGDMAQQHELLVAMEESLATAVDDSTAALNSSLAANDETSSLGTAVVALQGDLNAANGRIDALGGELDGLRGETAMLDSSVGDLGQLIGLAVEAASEISDMQQTIALFHVWELLTRARLRLVENNVGQATADVERAFRAIDALEATTRGTDDGALLIVRTRLALSFSGLPDNTTIAARDLESAWDELDQILMSRLIPGFEETDVIEIVEPLTLEATPALTPVPSPTSAPSPTPSPTTSP